jgi:RNA polymerase sigma factor (sigma-70 family)
MHGDPLPHADEDPLAQAGAQQAAPGAQSRLDRFEQVYRREFGAVAGYFARRCADPQLVADLTADTFVAAIRSFGAFEERPRSSRAWTIALARRVYDRWRSSDPRNGPDPTSLRLLLDRAERRELLWQIELERSSRELIERLERMPELDREAFELVEICGLSAEEAAHELALPVTALRVRLLHGRARLRREGGDDV